MKRVIWLKTARVYATDSDMTAKVERTIVKLEDGDNFNKFVKYIPLKGYKKDEQPYIEKVMENKSGQWVEIDKQPWVDKLNEVLKVIPVPDEKIDFKLLSERQANELKSTKATLAAMNERLQALEAKEQKDDDSVLKNQNGESIKGSDEVPGKVPTEKEIRKELFVKCEELGINMAKNCKTDVLKQVVEDAIKEKENEGK